MKILSKDKSKLSPKSELLLLLLDNKRTDLISRNVSEVSHDEILKRHLLAVFASK